MRSSPSLRSKLSGARPAFGILQSIPHVAFTEIAADVGFDFIILDCEHGQFSDTDCLTALLALKGTASAVLVRMAGIDPQGMGRLLDLGVDGIVIPDVRTATQAVLLAKAMEHTPLGTRGHAGPLARRGGYASGPGLAPSDGERPLLVAMIESAQGVTNAVEIAAIPGVDALVIGPFDLAADLGSPGDFATLGYTDAVTRIERAAIEQGKVVGTAPHPGFGLQQLAARGHRLLMVGADVVMIRESLVATIEKSRSIA